MGWTEEFEEAIKNGLVEVADTIYWILKENDIPSLPLLSIKNINSVIERGDMKMLRFLGNEKTG